MLRAMKTRLLLTASALVMAVLGLAAIFLPREILEKLHQTSVGPLPLLVQILGALYLGFAMQNWMAKQSIIGGIYNRPLTMGNLVHFLVAALSLAKYVLAGSRDPALLTLAALYTLFAVVFATVVFTSPVKPE
jgi:hypothetical protein